MNCKAQAYQRNHKALQAWKKTGKFVIDDQICAKPINRSRSL
ncbi:uncharacterized protein Dvar_59240 [Desulfosarcina variabilis str. Montpellier]